MNKHESENLIRTESGFSALGVAPSILEALSNFGYKSPTPIQRQAIPALIQGKDVVGIAQTGTGKTLAFGIPMIQRLPQIKGTGLVLVPTRELAIQVDEMLRVVGQPLGVRTAVLIGGVSIGPQIRALQRSPHIIIATPGRLLDHMQQRTVRLDDARIVVLDEADRMLDMGFAPQIQRIIRALGGDRQTMLFSATMPAAIMKMASAYMKLPIRVEIAPAGTPPERVTQEIFIINRNEKNRLLDKILEQHSDTTLIFTRTKFTAKRLAQSIRGMGHSVAEIHSNRSLAQRRDALEGFKSGRFRVLVATDIASRGIDVAGIGIVLNYDLPENPEDYVHRIGRTARAGEGGHAISFVTPDQKSELRGIERLIRKYLPISKLPELPPERPAPKRTFINPPLRGGFRRSGQRGRPFSNRGRGRPRRYRY